MTRSSGRLPNTPGGGYQRAVSKRFFLEKEAKTFFV
jgi:hypothetical protein